MDKAGVAEEVQQVFVDNIHFDDIGPQTDSFPLVVGQNGPIGSLRVYDLEVEQPVAVPPHGNRSPLWTGRASFR